MSTESIYTFVGGCADGERKRVPDQVDRVELCACPPYGFPSFASGSCLCASSKFFPDPLFDRHHYRKKYWHHTDGAVTVRIAYFVWDKITEVEALVKLIEGYDQRRY